MAVCLPTLAVKLKVKSILTLTANPKLYYRMTAEKSSCIFCNIINKLENTEILFEDNDICIFRDIKPASDYHILTVPKRHIEDAKCLTPVDKELGKIIFLASRCIPHRSRVDRRKT